MGERILITGYAGFIGTNLVREIKKRARPTDDLIGLDCFTYAARPDWAYQALKGGSNRFFEAKVDLRNAVDVLKVIQDYKPDRIYHLAAESHVCRSIEGPRAFAESNFMGTFNLLDALRQIDYKGRLLVVSTDEAFGDLRMGDSPFDEASPPRPTSPYAASKAAADLMARAFGFTYDLDVVITRCTNNFGPNQHEEKLIPKTILSIMEGKPVSLYGDGNQVREWISVDEHCRALMHAMEHAMAGQMLCIGSGLELKNRQVVERVFHVMKSEFGHFDELRIQYTNDRPTDDRRYAVDTNRIEQLGWKPKVGHAHFMDSLRETVKWYWGHFRQ